MYYRSTLLCVLAAFALFAAVIFGVYQYEKAKCHAKTKSFEGSDHGFFQGCMVKHNGRWLPLDNIRGFDDKS